jgi:hypothetical protein
MVSEIKGDGVENSGIAVIRPENFMSRRDFITAAGVTVCLVLPRNIRAFNLAEYFFLY